MDYGYTGTCRYEVRLADINNTLIGSGVLFVPGREQYAYVFTAAHLFWNIDYSNKKNQPSEIELLLTYAAYREESFKIKSRIRKVSDKDEYDDTIILIHSKYDLSKINSRWDAAILRIEYQPWMKKVKAFRFPSGYYDTYLSGWGYPETMSNTEEDKMGMADSFRESLPFEGNAKKYDKEYQEILFQYHEERSQRDLDGLSGTGLFAQPDLFFGVLSRDAGNEYSGSYTWVTAWQSFEEILGTLRNVGYERYIRASEVVDLNRQVWWLPESSAYYECGLMDDSYSINLQALLLGMTDSYTVVFASVWKGGIGESLEKQIHLNKLENLFSNCREWKQLWFEQDERFPEHDVGIEQAQGIIVNLCADKKEPYEIMEQVSDILRHREETMKECKLIININSNNPKIAFKALYQVWEMKSNRMDETVDFLSAISYAMLEVQENEVTWTEVGQIKSRLERMELIEMTRELIEYRDVKTDVWWKVLEGVVKSENEEEVLLGFHISKVYHPAMEFWISRLHAKWLAKWINRPEELRNRLSTEDIDLLCWELYLYQKGCTRELSVRHCHLLDKLKDYSSESVKNILDMLMNEKEKNELEKIFLQPTEVIRWAHTAGKEEFERNIPLLKSKKVYYWSAILNSVYGLRYVMDEIRDRGQSAFLGEILNQKVKDTKDIYQREDTEYIRSIIRRRR